MKRQPKEKPGKPQRQESGTRVKATQPWTDTDDDALRKEVEVRYRDRTPPQFLDEKNEMKRVSREEMEVWALNELRKDLPDSGEWAVDFILWYKRMVSRNQVHMRWMNITLCRVTGKQMPIRSDIESEITCETCRKIFSNGIVSRHN